MRILSLAWLLGSALGQSWSEHQLHPIDVVGMCADPIPGRLLLLGDDSMRTWTIEGDRFLPRADSPLPSPRYDFALAPDTGHRRVLLVGGKRANGSFATDAWSWDGQRWTVLPMPSPARANHTLVEDLHRGRMILHGGFAQQLPAPWGPTPTGDTFEFDGSQWTLVSPGGPVRTHHTMAFDPARNRCVLFGGQDGSSLLTNDTYEFGTAGWQRPTTTASPTGMWPTGMVFAPDHGALLLQGLTQVPGPLPVWNSETWVREGRGWRQLSSTRTDYGTTHGRNGGSLAIDAATGRAAWLVRAIQPDNDMEVVRRDLSRTGTWSQRPGPVLPRLQDWGSLSSSALNGDRFAFNSYFRFTITARTWVDSGGGWTVPTAATAPMPRTDSALVADAVAGRFLLFGGSTWPNTLFGDTWVFDGQQWLAMATPVAPAARMGHSMVLRASNQTVVLFGGADGLQNLADTWEWDGAVWRQRASTGPSPRVMMALAEDASTGTCYGFGGTDSYVAWLQDTWSWNGSQWQLLATGGPSVGQPTLCHDLSSGQLLLHQTTSMWRWQSPQWTPLGTAPAGRPAFDARIGQVTIELGQKVHIWSAAPAATQGLGTGCAGSDGPPRLEAYGTPSIHFDDFALGVTRAQPHAPILLLLDLQAAPTQLPGGCVLQLAHPVVGARLLADPFGKVTAPLPFPNLLPLLGIDLLAQAAVIDPQGALGGQLALTGGLRLQIGH